MFGRSLYIAVYDICQPSRLRKVRRVVKKFATGGQKSAYECFLVPGERDSLFEQVGAIMDESEDRFAMFRVEERAASLQRGIASAPADPDFHYAG